MPLQGINTKETVINIILGIIVDVIYV